LPWRTGSVGDWLRDRLVEPDDAASRVWHFVSHFSTVRTPQRENGADFLDEYNDRSEREVRHSVVLGR
jgi:hypothetical protein